MTTTVVVMGVSGSGKTAVARALADRLGWPLVEGDELHPEDNVAKMAAGVPLTDDDRWPWLRDVRDRIGELETAGSSTVLTCSALKRSYRDLLRTGRPSVQFVHLDVDPLLLQRRLEQRRGHWMPPTLLSSQLAALEPLQPDEPGVTMPADGPVEQVVDALLGVLR